MNVLESATLGKVIESHQRTDTENARKQHDAETLNDCEHFFSLLEVLRIQTGLQPALAIVVLSHGQGITDGAIRVLLIRRRIAPILHRDIQTLIVKQLPPLLLERTKEQKHLDALLNENNSSIRQLHV